MRVRVRVRGRVMGRVRVMVRGRIRGRGSVRVRGRGRGRGRVVLAQLGLKAKFLREFLMKQASSQGEWSEGNALRLGVGLGLYLFLGLGLGVGFCGEQGRHDKQWANQVHLAQLQLAGCNMGGGAWP